MNETLSKGFKIKARLINKISEASHTIYLAMTLFSDLDIANALIDAKDRGVNVEVILSNNQGNDNVKKILLDHNIPFYSFDNMNKKFCLIDENITLQGAYHYSVNASRNDENSIHISEDIHTYNQFFEDFKKLKNKSVQIGDEDISSEKRINLREAFHDRLHKLVYTSIDINNVDYKTLGFNKSMKTSGSIDIYRAELSEIKEKTNALATDEGLGGIKQRLVASIANAYDDENNLLVELESQEINSLNERMTLHLAQINDDIKEKSRLINNLESGNDISLSTINESIEKKQLDLRDLEENTIVKKFWTGGSIVLSILMFLLSFYLMIFFSSAVYKVFFEGNEIRDALEAGLNPGSPQLVDANAITKIYNDQGILFALIAILFFIIPILFSNLKLLGSKKKWANTLTFIVGIVLFDVVVAITVAMNNDEIKKLLIGETSTMKIWEVFSHGEFWLIFVFGMIPLIITHFVIDKLVDNYNQSRPEIVNEKNNHKMKLIKRDLIELESNKDRVKSKIDNYDNEVTTLKSKIHSTQENNQNEVEAIRERYNQAKSSIRNVYNDFVARVESGNIFTENIFDSISSSFKAGFVEYLPQFYATDEVTRRVDAIDNITKNI